MTVTSPHSTSLAGATVTLEPAGHELIAPTGGGRDLDAMLDKAREAERAGATAVEVPAAGAGAPLSRQWPATAQALAVLLATTRVRVVVPIRARAWDLDAVVRFATSAVGLAGDRLEVRVLGAGAESFARRLRARWTGPVVVDGAQQA